MKKELKKLIAEKNLTDDQIIKILSDKEEIEEDEEDIIDEDDDEEESEEQTDSEQSANIPNKKKKLKKNNAVDIDKKIEKAIAKALKKLKIQNQRDKNAEKPSAQNDAVIDKDGNISIDGWGAIA